MSLKHLTKDLASHKAADRRQLDKAVAESMLGRLFKQQADFVLDQHSFKSAMCPRRAGKTYACLVQLCYVALTKPRANIVYLCLTRGQASNNVWSYLKQFNDEFELGLRFHGTNLTATFPNGSVIRLMGAETRSEIDKLRGQAFDMVVVDEGKSFQGTVLEELIWEVLRPALADRRGKLVMIGTPGNILAGPFYAATVTEKPWPDAPGVLPYWWSDERKKAVGKRYVWSFHKWHVRDNVAMPHIWEEALATKAARGWTSDSPVWRREYEGEWCASDDHMVYALNRGHDNTWVPDPNSTAPHGLPEGHDWKYLLGMDIGFNDSTALVVAAYADTHPDLLHVWDYKQPHLTVPDIAKAVSKAIEIFGEFEAMVADTGGLAKTVVETLGQVYGQHFEPAEKKEKHDHIELVNSDLVSGRIKILTDSYLESEMRVLQWTDTTYKHEDPSLDNHCCDAFLYLWRHAFHHFWQQRSVSAPQGSHQWFQELEEAEFEAACERKIARKNQLESEDLLGDDILDGDVPWT